jgi:hypothetical protein
MTTRLDHGRRKPQMLKTPVRDSSLHPSLVLALRDMRMANGRDATTGEREGNESWIGLCLGMVVLDSLSKYTAGGSDQVRWTSLLKRHGISADDANTIFRLRCSLLHGYSLPKPEVVGGRRVLLTANQDGYAVDAWTGRTDHGDPAELILVSVPVFCGCLVERIAAEAPDDWDDALIDTRLSATTRPGVPVDQPARRV